MTSYNTFSGASVSANTGPVEGTSFQTEHEDIRSVVVGDSNALYRRTRKVLPIVLYCSTFALAIFMFITRTQVQESNLVTNSKTQYSLHTVDVRHVNWQGLVKSKNYSLFDTAENLAVNKRKWFSYNNMEDPNSEIAPIITKMKGGISSIGEYYINIFLGEPYQKVKLQVDTGSSSFVVAAADCDSCLSGLGGRYSREDSKTAETVSCSSKSCGIGSCLSGKCGSKQCSETQACCSMHDPNSCGFFIEYGGNTLYHVAATGTLVKEEAVIKGMGNDKAKDNVILYNTLLEHGPWPSSVDGIFGMGFPALSCNPTCSPLAFPVEVFSMCFGDSGGLLTLGTDGKEEGLAVGDIFYTPLVSSFEPTYYVVQMDSISMDGSELEFSLFSHQAIIDSGTTLLLLQDDIYKGFVRHLQTHYCWVPGVCTSGISIFEQGVCLNLMPKGLPILEFRFGSVLLKLPPSFYFIQYDMPDGPVYCLGIQSAGLERTVVGNTFMRRFHTVFDRKRRRVGFAERHVDLCGSTRISSAVDPLPPSEAKNAKRTSIALNAMSLTAGGILVASSILALIFIVVVAKKKIEQSLG